MHFRSISTVLIALLYAGLAPRLGSAHELKTRQTAGILISPPGLPQLPTAPQAARAASAVGLNLTNIQGDILVGMKKRKEMFFFFGIRTSSVATFKAKLASDIYPLVTTTMQLLLNVSKQPDTALNIAFSQSGLTILGINGTNDLNDTVFAAGQAADNGTLGDPGTKNWVPGFVQTKSLHGVFLLASDTVDKINAQLAHIRSILGNSIVEIHRLQGEARPGAEEGHEHFGFLDGIAQPAVEGFVSPLPGQTPVPASTILVGQAGDTRPAWASEGSFLAFRQLQQFRPEFDKFLTDNPIRISPLNVTQGSALMGARMVGRWKSGAPVELAPHFDDPTLGADPNRNNNFTYILAGDQSRCPFSAHLRKTNPRDFLLPSGFPTHHIMRAGIPYGPEGDTFYKFYLGMMFENSRNRTLVTATEARSNTTSIERGLAFVAYQSNIADGFRFLQNAWANNPGFFNHTGDPGVPGFDPIIGANHSLPRNVSGLDAANETRNITLQRDFIESRGGEYFFSPSLSAIIGTLAV